MTQILFRGTTWTKRACIGEQIRKTKIILFSSKLGDVIEDHSTGREARALLYWMTTTSTFTWYTSTSTIATIECTPSGFSVSSCYAG